MRRYMCIIGSLIIVETKEKQNGLIRRSEPFSTHLKIQGKKKYCLICISGFISQCTKFEESFFLNFIQILKKQVLIQKCVCIYTLFYAFLKHCLRCIQLPTNLFVSKVALLIYLPMKKLHVLLKQRHLPLFTQPTAHKILKKERHFKILEI